MYAGGRREDIVNNSPTQPTMGQAANKSTLEPDKSTPAWLCDCQSDCLTTNHTPWVNTDKCSIGIVILSIVE